MKNYGVILASGTGNRYGNDLPKQFNKLAGKTILEHTVDVFEANDNIDEIIIVITPKFRYLCEDILIKNNYKKVSKLLNGGDTRQQSSEIAVKSIQDDNDTKIVIHDAARPFITHRIINDCIKALDKYDAVDVAIPAIDTIIETENEIVKNIPNRANLQYGQTPQCFKLGIIKAAHQLAKKDTTKFTDDCGMVVKYNLAQVYVIPGDINNIKITYPVDIYIADKLFQLKHTDIYDENIKIENLKDISYSAYILPVRDGQVALLKYGENGYGPIGGRLDDGEDFLTALRRELTEELGESVSALADSAVEIPVPYAFRHPTPERAQKRGAWGEEHHFFIVHVPDDMELNFCENRPEEISIAWIAPDDLLNPKITPFDDMREFYATHLLPNLDCKFSMSLRPEYYEMVCSGEKDIELRLYDEKRRRMHNGDTILIYDAQNRNDYIRAKIVRLHIARSFADLATKISMPRTGFASLNALMSAVSKFYDAEMESKYGIVGIELEVI